MTTRRRRRGRRRLPATIFACGRAAERTAPVLAMLAADGHEVAGHGWLWRPHAEYEEPEREARDLDRMAEAIAAPAGRRPVTFFRRGAESPWTRRLLAKRGYLYTSSGFDDDLPYRDGKLLVVPYALDANDMKFRHSNGFVRASEMVDYVRDVLEAEAASGLPRLLNLSVHLRIAGRPGRFRAFKGVLSDLAAREGRVWVATREAIARASLEATG